MPDKLPETMPCTGFRRQKKPVHFMPGGNNKAKWQQHGAGIQNMPGPIHLQKNS